jgi:hypothetical protein
VLLAVGEPDALALGENVAEEVKLALIEGEVDVLPLPLGEAVAVPVGLPEAVELARLAE